MKYFKPIHVTIYIIMIWLTTQDLLIPVKLLTGCLLIDLLRYLTDIICLVSVPEGYRTSVVVGEEGFLLQFLVQANFVSVRSHA